MTKEALKLALEALERCVATCFDPYEHEQAMSGSEHFVNQTITAIEEALAQPEQEPVVCDCDSPSWCKQYKKCNRKMLGFMPYVAQPQRTWVGLTDEEYAKLAEEFGPFPINQIEAKLKEKNNG